MPERVETIVIGAGQAGLSVSYHLTQRGREHVVLERGEIAETWRTQRWDGFYLNTPNWSLQLPGHHYAGPEPDRFAPLADAIAYLEAYGRAIAAPVRTGVEVTGIRARGDRGWLVEANGDALETTNVVVATGAFQRPHVPVVGDTNVFQLHAVDYRRPEQLPPGAVLVVGSGQTGCQIAEELLGAGRTVYLSIGSCPWFPRRYRGRDLVGWAIDIGLMDETVDTLPSPAARLACNPALSGNDDGHDCNPRTLASAGAILVGRVERVDAARVSFQRGVEENLAKGDEFEAKFKSRIDEYLQTSGTDAPEDDAATVEQPVPPPRIEQLDLRGAEVGTILWTTGYRPDFGWIGVPLDDGYGWPAQQRGVTAHPGLYFVGLNWMHKRKSALLLGVGEDAEHVVARLAGE
ncbi:MAG TPA: NAD(P)-binding domain-containing protein [Gaiellaceae bacterium]|jgi:putative flavoprotein involved in K+ transport|nr:NAD(P)-binding domain-containing protein [Gaiellaceae bacterium]